MKAIPWVIGLMFLCLVAGAAFNGGAEAGWWLLGGLALVIILGTHTGAFFAGVLLARALLNDGARVAVGSSEIDARKARAYSDVLVTGIKASHQFRQPAAAVPVAAAPPMLGASSFVIEGLDQDYEAFGEVE